MKKIGRKRLNKIIKEEVVFHTLMESNARKTATLTNRATRAIMDLIKTGSTTKEQYEILDKNDLIDTSDWARGMKTYNFNIDFLPGKIDDAQMEDDYDVDDSYLAVSLFLGKGEDVHVSGDSINRLGSPGVHVSVLAPTNITSQQLSLLRLEISNTLRHEIEHMLQGLPMYYDGEYAYDDFVVDGNPIAPRTSDYYLDPTEVSAHIMGYAHNAKSLKELENEIRSMLQNWARDDWETDPRQFIAPEDVELITAAWIDWAKKHLQRARFKS